MAFGISDDDQVVGLADAESDAEKISEEIKTKLDPIPTVDSNLRRWKARNWYYFTFIMDKKHHITI